jgi:hypothetical protein
MMNRATRWAIATMGALCLASLPGVSAATSFYFTSGSATVTATAGGSSVLSATVVAIDGVFIEFDEAGNGQLVDFDITLPQSGTLNLSTPYGGYDQVVIESADLSPGIGFSNLNNQNLGGGIYTFLAGPTDINGVYSASDSTLTNPPMMNVPVPFVDTSLLSGTVNVTLGTLELTGITLTMLPGGAFGEANDLVVKADISFTGLVPEPGTGLLMGVGLTLMTIRRRSRISH